MYFITFAKTMNELFVYRSVLVSVMSAKSKSLMNLLLQDHSPLCSIDAFCTVHG